MHVREITKILEDIAPLDLQEGYDNAGLLTGNPDQEVTGVLCTLDVTQEVLDEAIALQANLIVSHHPLIFGSLKSLTGRNATEQILIRAIKNDIAVYAAHTNMDNVSEGVNRMISEKLGLEKVRILSPQRGLLSKLVTFVPEAHADKVREVIFSAGAGHIGNYDSCSYNLSGTGTFRGGESTNPFVGEKGKLHHENEIRIETIVPKNIMSKVLSAMIAAHPYEEVAYDVYPLENSLTSVGAGMIGELRTPLQKEEFLVLLKTTFNIPVIRYAGKENQVFKRIAVCGGAGSFLLSKAIREKADVFITGDIKYHQFFEPGNQIMLCDIGHYESEQFTKELFYTLLTKKISNFAVHLSKIVTNPIKYYT
jgi:dinuclear metal center YbgI/SA1388 family protein